MYAQLCEKSTPSKVLGHNKKLKCLLLLLFEYKLNTGTSVTLHITI